MGGNRHWILFRRDRLAAGDYHFPAEKPEETRRAHSWANEGDDDVRSQEIQRKQEVRHRRQRMAV